MKNIICAILLAVITFSMSAQSKRLTENEQRQLVSSLNYLQYSIAKIKNADNKAVADEEYYSVINELKIEAIGDGILNYEFSNFLDNCSGLKLKQNEKDFLRQINEKAEKKAYLNAFSNLGAVFIPGHSPQQLVSTLIYTSVANSFSVANAKNKLNTQLEKDMFYLDQDIMELIYNMQSTLFLTSAKLLDGSIASGRINEDSMNMFVKAISLKTPQERINALSEPQLLQNFSMFPPLWFELGKAYQEIKNYESALSCYEKFEDLKKHDIVIKDKNYVNLIQNRIQILLGDDITKADWNARRYKRQILNNLKLMSENYLDSEAGEKNAYMAKIYYLIGEYDQCLSCLNYIINSKTIYPELIEDAIALKMLISSSFSSDKKEVYQAAYNYSKILFGHDSQYVMELFAQEDTNLWDNVVNIWNKAKNLISKEDADVNDIIDNEHLCFTMPNAIINNFDLDISIDNIYFAPILLELEDNSTTLAYLNYEIDDIDNTKTLVLHCSPKGNMKETIAEFSITPIDEDVYQAATKAFNRIGSDIVAHNAEKAVLFGKTIVEYDYEVDNEAKLNEKIRKEKEKWGKENNKTRKEIESEITKEYAGKLAPDMLYLQERFKVVEQEYYSNKKSVLYAPSIVRYGNDHFLVGIRSIYDSNTDKEYFFDANGDVYYKDKVQFHIAAKEFPEYYEMAAGGDVTSMVNIGIAYFEGYGVKRNPAEAVRWLLKAYSQIEQSKSDIIFDKMTIAQGCKILGTCYSEGIGVQKNETIATEWFKKAQSYGFDIEKKYLD